ncbi:MAG: DegT/DnrJ/EryC1/StrS family aminotransferase, partial [Marinoscillum sp.]
FGHVACFSFYPSKNLGAIGDAGAIVTNDQNIDRNARLLANHGRLSKYDHEIVGYNSRLDTIQAAILGIKLPYLDAWNKSRIASAKIYTQMLGKSDLISPDIIEDGSHVFHLYVVRIKNRDQIKVQLSERGISSGIHYPIALPNTLAYRNLEQSKDGCPNAVRFADEILSLPMFPMMKQEEVEYIAAALHKLCQINGTV